MNRAKGTSRAWRPHTLRDSMAGLVDHLKNSEKLLVRFVALVRDARTFVHRARPLYWSEVRRVRKLGRRYLLRMYGESSAEAQKIQPVYGAGEPALEIVSECVVNRPERVHR